ncbi:MAG: hypothetical protein WAM58_04685 [Candidatus Acidiferrum sp.]
MNGRISKAETPEARLAAVAVALLKSIPEKTWWRIDYADFEEALRPYVKRELLNARLEELRRQRTSARDQTVVQERELFQQLVQVEKQISEHPFERPGTGDGA